MRNRLSFCLCILCLFAALPVFAGPPMLTSNLASEPCQVPAGGGLQLFYGTIENPTGVLIYLTSVAYDTPVTLTGSSIPGAINFFRNMNHYGLPIPPGGNVGSLVSGPLGTIAVGATPTSPISRAPYTFGMHLQGIVATDLTSTVDVGDITVTCDPYLPIVSNLDGSVFHVGSGGGVLTITGNVSNGYSGGDTNTGIPTTLGITSYLLAPVKILSQNLNSSLSKLPAFAPGGSPVNFAGPYGMYVLQIPKGTPSFTCRLLFWSDQVEDLVVGYADFQVIVGP